MSAMSTELMHAYVSITKEKLSYLKTSLVNLKNDKSDITSIDELYISVIEIEKISSALKNEKMTNFTKQISHILFKLRQEKSKIGNDMLDLLENCHDFIYESITQYDSAGTTIHHEDFDDMAHILLLKMKLQLLSSINLTVDKNFSIW